MNLANSIFMSFKNSMIGPVPPTKIPETLIVRTPNTNSFWMFNTNSGNIIGNMHLSKREDEMFISWLNIMPGEKRKGHGTEFLNFAKNMSKLMGFNGRVRVMAAILPFDLHNPPHIFYRKYGFTSDDKKVLNKIDKAIRKNKQLTISEAPITYMYYNPDLPEQVKVSPLKKLLKCLSKFRF